MDATTLPPSPLTVARSAWRRLRTMRTAIILLLLLGAGAAVGSFFPQRPIDPAAVDRWVEGNGSFARVAEFLGLFDVYGAWWFMAIYALLLVSLVGCLVPRFRAFWRAVRSRPSAHANLLAQPHYHAADLAADPDEALARAGRALRARRFRVAREADVVAAERGHWREGGSLLFHTAFLVLLLGMSVGKLFGYSGQAAVIEGETFTDTPIEYDFLEEGRYFGESFQGFQIALEDFDVSWYPNGVPRAFVASVRLIEEGAMVREEDIEVNSPLTHRGRRVYLLSWGWAPHIRVAQHGKVLYDGPTVFLSGDGQWHGVAKIPQTEPLEMGLQMLFFTDPRIGADRLPRDASPEPRRPVLLVQQMLGNLRLDEPQSVYRLDPRELSPGETRALALGETARLPNGIEVTFGDLGQYAVFQIAANPGAGLLLIAAGFILVGLVPALYSSRRRVWVRATLDGVGTRLEIAGHALQRRSAFEEEFAALVRELGREGKQRIEVPSG